MFQPEILAPQPEPWFIRELHLIDPDLRVVWAYQRYLKRCWVIERKLSPERYQAAYCSLLQEGAERFVDQPIYDTNQPIVDAEGEQTSYACVGYRRFDLMPDWEWLHSIELPDGGYKPLSHDDLIALRREYAWNRNHAFSRARYEAELAAADEKKEADKKQVRVDAAFEGVQEAWHLHGKIKTVGQPVAVMDGTEL